MSSWWWWWSGKLVLSQFGSLHSHVRLSELITRSIPGWARLQKILLRTSCCFAWCLSSCPSIYYWVLSPFLNLHAYIHISCTNFIVCLFIKKLHCLSQLIIPWFILYDSSRFCNGMWQSSKVRPIQTQSYKVSHYSMYIHLRAHTCWRCYRWLLYIPQKMVVKIQLRFIKIN